MCYTIVRAITKPLKCAIGAAKTHDTKSIAVAGLAWLGQNQTWVLTSASRNHKVVNKQNAQSQSGSLKTSAKSRSIFYQVVEICQFYPNEFYTKCHRFHCFLFSNHGFRIAKTNCLQFPLTLAYRRPPSWIQWNCLRSWFDGFTNPDSVSENLALTNTNNFETGFSVGLKQGWNGNISLSRPMYISPLVQI